MKKSNKFSPEVRERAVRLVQEHRGEYPSLWAAIESIAPKIGCVPQTLNEWVKRVEVDTGGRDGVTTAEAQHLLRQRIRRTRFDRRLDDAAPAAARVHDADCHLGTANIDAGHWCRTRRQADVGRGAGGGLGAFGHAAIKSAC